MNIGKMEMVERRAARFALNRYHNTSSVSDMLQQLGWVSLRERRMMLRLSKGYGRPGHLDTQEPLLTTTRSPRHLNCSRYKVPFSRTLYHQMYFSRGRFAIGINYQILLCWPQLLKPSRTGRGTTERKNR